jgi:opacity protein-like surface antigen
MNKKLLVLVVVFTLFALAGSSALALAPMGPPTAGLKTGQVRAGVEYSYSNVDLKVEDDEDTYTIKDIKVNMFTVNIGYGIMDEWEAFARFGAANAKKSNIWDEEDDEYTVDFSGDYKFAWGLGTKFTFLKQENIDWGVLFQIGWLNTEYGDSGSEVFEEMGTYAWDDTFKLSVYDMEIAVGPTWKAAEGLSIYGGPFFNLINGDLDEDWTETYDDGETEPEIDSGTWSADVKQKAVFGGYVGAQFDLSENASVFGELQFTGGTCGAWTFATGVGWKF